MSGDAAARLYPCEKRRPHVHGMLLRTQRRSNCGFGFHHSPDVNNCAIAMAFGMAVILAGMAAMILDCIPAAQGELVFLAGLAILLGGAIGEARKD